MTTHFATVPISALGEKALMADTGRPAPYVLVVDDDAMIADTLAQILRDAGYAVATAYDAETALELAELAPPHIVISDICMPDMDGIELAVRLFASVPDCQIVLTSGNAHCAEWIEAHPSAHRFRFLAKPFPPERLLEELCVGATTTQGVVPALRERKAAKLVL
jgi:DNA-binding NtrC family response regulator